MQRDAERDLIGAWRQGDLPATQGFVRARQTETLTVAYLLTADRDRARGLACAAFLRFFEDSRTLDPDADMRAMLLVQLGRRFLRGEYEAERPRQPGVMAGAEPRKYGVESQRDRALAALGRLDERERLALVLGEVAGFEPEHLNQVLERGNTALVAPVETGRQRIRQSLDIPQGESVRPALLEAGFDGPRDELWPHLEDPLDEIWNRNQRRSQILTYGVIGGVALIALIGIAVMFGSDILNGNNDMDTTVEIGVLPPADDATGIGPLAPTLMPMPTPSPTPLPAGSVPNSVLAEMRYERNTVNAYSTLAVYNSASNELQPVPGDEERFPSTLSGSTGISPDGGQIVNLRGEWLDGSVRYTATAFDSATMERQWHVEVGAFDVIPNGGLSVRMAIALTSDRVYLAILGKDAPDTATIVALDPETGETQETAEIDVDPASVTVEFRGSVHLFVPPDESRLVFAIEMLDRVAAGSLESFTHSVRIPGLEVIDTTAGSRIDAGREFPLFSAHLTPDGSSLYTLASINHGWPPRILFHHLNTRETSVIDLPFRNTHDLPYPVLSTLLSHDGHRLYAIDRVSGNVAVINLIERRLERSFPVDMGAFSSRFGTGADQMVFGWGRALSQDGERLYIAAGIGNQSWSPRFPDTTGVWVIDLREWKVVDFWPVQGVLHDLFADPDDRSVLVRHWYNDNPEGGGFSPYRLSKVGPSSEEQVESPRIDDPGNYMLQSFAELYRAQHGRSPAIDGTEPRDLDSSAMLPRIEALAPPDVVAGTSMLIAVRVLDPETGEPLDSENQGIRFDPDSTITVILKSEGRPERILILAKISPSEYQTTTILRTAGDWTIDVIISAPDGATATAAAAGGFEVADPS